MCVLSEVSSQSGHLKLMYPLRLLFSLSTPALLSMSYHPGQMS